MEDSKEPITKKHIECWYDRRLRLWTAIMIDENDHQVGTAGYGMSELEAKCDLQDHA